MCSKLHINEQRRDPTRTTALRNQFAAEVSKRFKKLSKLVKTAIVDRDVFGLQSEGRVRVFQAPGYREFAFERSSRKVSEFMKWFREEVQNEILSVSDVTQVGEGVEAAWTNKYVNDSYNRGVRRARIQLKQQGLPIPNVGAVAGGVAASFVVPVHLDRLGLVYTRTFTELKAITDEMDRQISQVLARGIADGDGADLLARKLNRVIIGGGNDLGITDTLGRYIPAERRAKVMVRTEVVRAHAEAQLQEFVNWGVEGVGVEAEWVTAGDNRVCPICEGLQGQTFSIEDARGRLPAHPQCRCAWIPKVSDELRERYKRAA